MNRPIFRLCTLASLVATSLVAPRAHADDIDIFLSNASGTSTAANVMFLIDNTADFSGNNQKVPGQSQTGQAEVDAITQVTAALNASTVHANIGVAFGTTNPPNTTDCVTSSGSGGPSNTCVGGAYVLFGARDMAVNANFIAFSSILGYGPTSPSSLLPASCTGSAANSVYCNITGAPTKINDASKDESAWLYELFLYFTSKSSPASAMNPAWAGDVSLYSSSNKPVQFADYPGNTQPQTGAGQGLTSGFALFNGGHKYVGPPDTGGCGNNYIVYIVNAPQSTSKFSSGEQQINGTNAGSYISVSSGYPSWTPTWTKFLHDHQITTYIIDVYNANPPPATYTNVLTQAAIQGGTNLLTVKSETVLVDTLTKVLAEILGTNSAFAATALPASATNRSVDQNQVYLGVFRPDTHARPTWFGNLKRYQIGLSGNVPVLADATGAIATNSDPTKGFLGFCAASFWTKDSSAYKPGSSATAVPYWSIGGVDPSPLSSCAFNSLNPASTSDTNSSPQFQPPSGVTWSGYSDSPDGQFVEKGGVAEVLRRGNVAATSTDTWQAGSTHRTVLTGSGSPIPSFPPSGQTAANLGVPSTSTLTVAQVQDFVLGWDPADENGNFYTSPNDPNPVCSGSPPTNAPCHLSGATETRQSIHGDVIHSTPLPVTYLNTSSGVTKVVVYYGSNDGMYHGVDADTGVEKWAYLAPEFYTRMNRLYTKSPQISYPGFTTGTPTPLPKDYFFDGSTGVYQSSESPPLTDWIYPTMRRGGRMIYAFDVSPQSGGDPPTQPRYLWKAGCDDVAGTCTPSGIDGIGQTWSKPITGTIKNGPTDSSPKPMVVVGGGYDSAHTTTTTNGVTTVTYAPCEDTPNTSKTTSCSDSSRKGKVVYVIDAQNGPGTLFSAIPLPSVSSPARGSVAGDVALIDFDGDGQIDYAYLADTMGNVYRLDFVDRTSGTAVVLASSDWPSHIYRIAHTNANSEGRKFLFGPTLLINQGTASKPLVYVGLGSGDREHPLAVEYPYTTPVQNRFYLFLDDPTSKTTDLYLDDTSKMENATPASNQPSDQIPCPTNAGTTHSGVTPNSFQNPYSGWFMDLNNDVRDTTSSPVPTNANGHGGEQTVTPAVIVAGQVSWGTNLPNPNTANDVCTQTLGNAYGYLVALTNGSGAIGGSVTGTCGGNVDSPFAGGGLPLPPTVGTVPVTDSSGNTTYVGVCIGCPSKSGGTVAGISPQTPFPTSGEKRTRVYWFTPNYN